MQTISESRQQIDARLRAETATKNLRRPQARTAALRREAAAAFLSGVDEAVEKVYIIQAGHATLEYQPVALLTVDKPNPCSPANRARRERHAINRGNLRRY